MMVLAVTWRAHEKQETKVAAIFGKLQEASRKEPGCLMYVVHQHLNDPRRFFVYEQYRDQAALESHWNSPHFLQYAKQELRSLGERVEGELFRPI